MINNLKIILLFTLSSFAGLVFSNDTLSRNWNIHQGSYLGSQIGFNFSKISFSLFDEKFDSDRHGTTTQELIAGHFFYPNWAIETGIGSYFSSLGLGIRLGTKYYIPVRKKINLSLQGGANYIYTVLDNGFIGPYAGAGIEYSLNKHIALTLNFNDIISSARIGSVPDAIKGNFFSAFAGFSYYLEQ